MAACLLIEQVASSQEHRQPGGAHGLPPGRLKAQQRVALGAALAIGDTVLAVVPDGLEAEAQPGPGERGLGAEAQRRDLRQRRAGAVLGTHEIAEQAQTERTDAGRREGVMADLELRAREARVSRLELDHR